ncbi:class I SAM-dependent methyltransferase [Methanocella arvoryzae]|uniref:Methyltransferase type 11 domain-containing protein n=1 Tax=Methanocella arvoryzae (strain DSM 22066 / NBRC 105507 / MRE50) TaxID=351160 RepID=Q0W7F5_METAR|nr:class I SAM-dependent methyltransferase [Methanocella arvoryzae]CAJ35688.1 conserved hypothetical protein [Methanocella arvoryzae MRE50]
MPEESGNLRKYRNKNPLLQILIKKFIKSIHAYIYSLDVDYILDAGCGEGIIMKSLHGRNLCGIDISTKAIALAKEMNPGSNVFCGTLYSLPFKDESFDLILSIETLEHLYAPENALRELKRVTKKYCIVSVPNEPFFCMMNLLRGKNISRLGNDVEHLQKWGRTDLCRLIEPYFEIVDVKTPFPWIVVLCKKK